MYSFIEPGIQSNFPMELPPLEDFHQEPIFIERLSTVAHLVISAVRSLFGANRIEVDLRFYEELPRDFQYLFPFSPRILRSSSEMELDRFFFAEGVLSRASLLQEPEQAPEQAQERKPEQAVCNRSYRCSFLRRAAI